MAKKKDHTGFRNGDFFCFNCGAKYNPQLPQPVNMLVALMKEFSKEHKNCEKTWTEPFNNTEGKTEVENANWWAQNGEHGTSSKTMFNCLGKGIQISLMRLDRLGHPSDPDDFSRCYKLLQAVPQWKVKLEKLKQLSPEWSTLVDNWDKLTEMYEQNVKENWKNHEKIGMFQFMEQLIMNARK